MSRKLQLEHTSEILGVEFKITPEDIRNHFIDIVKLYNIKTDKTYYQDTIFFFWDDIWCMEFSNNTGKLWCSYRYIWSIFEKEYELKSEDIEILIMDVMKENFKTRSITSVKFIGEEYASLMEDHFKTSTNKPQTNIFRLISMSIPNQFKF